MSYIITISIVIISKYGIHVNIIHQEFAGRENLEKLVLISK